MKPIRVLHVIPGVSPKDGGPTVALQEMAAATARLGVSVTVATSDDDAGGRLAVPLGTPVLQRGVEYWYFSRSLPGTWKASWGLGRWLARNVARFDIVHVHAMFSFSTIPACRYAFRARVPVVLRPLGTITPWSMSHRAWKKRPYFSLIERSHLAGAAAIHVTSESERDDVAALGFGAHVRVIPLGVDLPLASPMHVPTTGESLRLLFLSRLHQKKGLPLLLDAMAALRDAGTNVTLTIAGGGAPSYRAELESRAAGLRLENLVRFVGHIEGQAKRELLARADAYVLPSYQENFGIAVAEALAAGLPVIVSDQVGIAPEIAAAEAGFVVPVDVGPLAAAISALAASPELRTRMGVRAFGLAREKFSWDRTASNLLALYEELRANANRRAG